MIEEILKLVDAGFTKDEILAMTAKPEAPAEPTPTPEAPAETPTPAPAEQTPEPEAPAKPEEPASQYDMLVKKLEEISNRIITNNINVDTMAGKPEKTIDDIMASVINPPQLENKK